LRLILGLLQISGATTSLIFLPQSAPIWLTITAVAVTLLLTIISRILFSPREPKEGK